MYKREDIMKKKFLIICLSFFCALGFSQTNSVHKKNELQFKTGIYPFIGLIMPGGIFTNAKVEYAPIMTFDYLNYLTKHIGFGCSFTGGTPIYVDSKKTSILSFKGDFRGIYLSREKLRLYGEIGLGATILFEEGYSPSLLPAFNIVPLGIQFGTELFFGIAEVALGIEGSFLTLGCGLRF